MVVVTVAVQVAEGREARAEAASLKGDLADLQTELASAAQQLDMERTAGAELRQQVMELQRRYTEMGDQLESEQNRIMQACS